jgi:hypothetical protein
MIEDAKRPYYNDNVSECNGEPKKLFRLVDTLLGAS